MGLLTSGAGEISEVTDKNILFSKTSKNIACTDHGFMLLNYGTNGKAVREYPFPNSPYGVLNRFR